jgi:hypothetical protein
MNEHYSRGWTMTYYGKTRTLREIYQDSKER